MTALRDHADEGIAWRERAGGGPVLVGLHGIGSAADSFDTLAGHLPADWRLIAWDMPGYGGSDPLPGQPLADDYAAALGRLLDRVAPDGRVHLLGHSLGTLIATAFAAAHPDRVGSLALLSCAQGYGAGPDAPLPPKARARLDDLARLGPAAFAAARAAGLVHDPDRNPALVARIAGAMARVRQPGYGQAVRMLACGDLAASAARLAVPTAILVGAEDRVTPPEQAIRVHAALPGACDRGLAVVPEAGHALYQQAPKAVARLLSHLIEEDQHV